MNSFNPYSADELTELERLQAQMRGEVLPPPVTEARATEWQNAQAHPLEASLAAMQPPAPPPAPALDLTMPAVAPRKGMVTGSVTTETNPYADRLMALNKQLADQQTGTINRAGQVEEGVQARHIEETSGRITDARDRETQTQIQLTAEQAAKAKLQKEGAEWAARKDQPEKAFEGMEWAGILGAIGIAAGVFSQAMGWQNGNPVKDAFNEHIERTISAQREQKNSMLKNIESRLGDSVAAENLLRAQLNDAVANRLQAELQKSQDLDAQARLGPLLDERRDMVKNNVIAAYERLAPRQSESHVRAPGKAGPPTLAQQLAEQEAAQKLRQGKVSAAKEAGLTDEEANKLIDERFPSLAAIGRGETTAQRDESDKAARAKQADKDKPKERTEDQAKAASAEAAIQRLAESQNLTLDPNTGEYNPSDDMLTPRIGEKVKSAATLGFGAAPIGANQEAAEQAYGRFLSGATQGAEEVKSFGRQLGARALTPRQLADNLNAARNVIRERLREEERKGSTLPSTIRRKVP